MRTVRRIACFEVRLVFSDRWSILWLLLMPFVMILFFAHVFPQGGDPSAAKVRLGVCNKDAGFLSGALIEDLASTAFGVAEGESLEKRPARGWWRTLIIPEDFTAHILEGRRVTLTLDIEPGSNQAALLAARVNIYKAVGRLLGNLSLLKAHGQPLDVETGAATYQRTARLEPRVKLEASYAGKGRVIPGGYNQTVPGMIVMGIIFSVLTYGTGFFAYDRRTGLLRRLVAAPCLTGELLAGKLLGRVLMGFIQAGILLGVSCLALGFYLGNSFLGWLLVLVPYAFACGALGMLLGCFFRSEDQVITFGWISPVLMAALGGCWWPREIVPDYLNYLGHLFPPAWAMDGLQQLISYGGDASTVLPHAAVLSGFLLLFMTLCVRFFRYD